MNAYTEQFDKARKLREEGKYAASLKHYRKLEEGERLSPDQHSELLYGLAVGYKETGETDLAVDYFRQALERGRKREKRADQAAALHQLGIIARERGDLDDAITCFRDELAVWNSHMEGYFNGLSSNFYQQGITLMEKGEYTDARMYLNHSFTFADTEDNYYRQGCALQALGQLEMKLNKRKIALRTLRHAYTNFKKDDNKEGVNAVLALIREYEEKH